MTKSRMWLLAYQAFLTNSASGGLNAFLFSSCMLCISTLPASCHSDNRKRQKRRIIPAVSPAPLEAGSARHVRHTPVLRGSASSVLLAQKVQVGWVSLGWEPELLGARLSRQPDCLRSAWCFLRPDVNPYCACRAAGRSGPLLPACSTSMRIFIPII